MTSAVFFGNALSVRVVQLLFHATAVSEYLNPIILPAVPIWSVNAALTRLPQPSFHFAAVSEYL